MSGWLHVAESNMTYHQLSSNEERKNNCAEIPDHPILFHKRICSLIVSGER